MVEVKGDLLDLAEQGKFDVIIHGCNCYVTMGAGIAKYIKEKWPSAFEADRETVVGDYDKLGEFTFTTVPNKGGILFIINAYTQFTYWKRKKGINLDYTAVKEVFEKIKKNFGDKNLRFGIPKIGAGLAGGDWNKISKIIDTAMEGENLTVVVL